MNQQYLPIPSPLIAKELILDILYDAVENGITEISQNEIMHFMGVPDNQLDKSNKVLYDLSNMTKKHISHMSDQLMTECNK